MPVNDNSARANRARSSRRLSVEERFFAKVEFTDAPCTTRPELGPCWLWTANKNGAAGYGRIRINGKSVLAHRWIYEYCVGSIPSGLEIDHLCRVRNCVNFTHLEPVTSRINCLRGDSVVAKNAVKTSCKRGHLLSGENLYIQRGGGRECRRCAKVARQQWHLRKKAAS